MVSYVARVGEYTDVPEVYNLAKEFIHTNYASKLGYDSKKLFEFLLSYTNFDNSVMILVESEDKKIGGFALINIDDFFWARPKVDIYTFYVGVDHRKTDAARKLIESIEVFANEIKAGIIRILISPGFVEDNKKLEGLTVNAFKKYGYEKFGIALSKEL